MSAISFSARFSSKVWKLCFGCCIPMCSWWVMCIITVNIVFPNDYCGECGERILACFIQPMMKPIVTQCSWKSARVVRIFLDKSKFCGQFWSETMRETNRQTVSGHSIACSCQCKCQLSIVWINSLSVDKFTFFDNYP